MQKIVIATNNKHKSKEIGNILNIDGIEFVTLKDIGIDFDVEETGLSFKNNAEKKAIEYYNLCKMPVIAEDSGLCIDSLYGYPGIFSKRIYEGKSEAEGNQIILDNLKDEEDRSAKYVAIYCYYDGINKIFAKGNTRGKITFEEKGVNGFAYDKIFLSNDLGITFAEATDEQKNSVSHRKRGLELLKNKISDLISLVVNGKWMYNLNGDEIWSGEEFDTREEAIKEGIEEIKEEGLDNIRFEIGQITEVSVSGVDVDYILENVAQNTTDDVGEVGEYYLDDVTKEDRAELEEKLNEVLFKWVKKHGYEPSFFRIENTEKIELA